MTTPFIQPKKSGKDHPDIKLSHKEKRARRRARDAVAGEQVQAKIESEKKELADFSAKLRADGVSNPEAVARDALALGLPRNLLIERPSKKNVDSPVSEQLEPPVEAQTVDPTLPSTSSHAGQSPDPAPYVDPGLVGATTDLTLINYEAAPVPPPLPPLEIVREQRVPLHGPAVLLASAAGTSKTMQARHGYCPSADQLERSLNPELASHGFDHATAERLVRTGRVEKVHFVTTSLYQTRNSKENDFRPINFSHVNADVRPCSIVDISIDTVSAVDVQTDSCLVPIVLSLAALYPMGLTVGVALTCSILSFIHFRCSSYHCPRAQLFLALSRVAAYTLHYSPTVLLVEFGLVMAAYLRSLFTENVLAHDVIHRFVSPPLLSALLVEVQNKLATLQTSGAQAATRLLAPLGIPAQLSPKVHVDTLWMAELLLSRSEDFHCRLSLGEAMSGT